MSIIGSWRTELIEKSRKGANGGPSCETNRSARPTTTDETKRIVVQLARATSCRVIRFAYTSRYTMLLSYGALARRTV